MLDVFMLCNCTLLVPMPVIHIPAPSHLTDWPAHAAAYVQHVLAL